ncbi:MAG: hypothetical protein H0U54_15970 [Acidobacteria bacterium]|nr:hypothetical protein [Acidobacteriota bacterium]
MAERKWEKVDITLTDEERKSFRNALIIFAVIEALVLIPAVLYRIFR